MFKTNAATVTLSGLAILLVSCNSPKTETNTQNQAETVSTEDQQAASVHAASVAARFIQTCIKLGGDQDKIAADLGKVKSAPIKDAKLGRVWEQKIDGKPVQIALSDGTYKNKPTKDCSFITQGANISDILAELAKQAPVKRFGSSIVNGQLQRIFTLDDQGNSFMVVASEEAKNGQRTVALTAHLVKASK